MVNEILNIVYFALLIGAPLPLGMHLLSRLNISKYDNASPAECGLTGYQLLTLMVLWLCLQTLVGLLLSLIGGLTPVGLLITESLMLGSGFMVSSQNTFFSPASQLAARVHNLTWLEKTILLLIAITGLIIWANASREPVSNFDSLYYHMPMMANWFQTGSLGRLNSFAQISYYPYHWELIAALFLFPFHTDFQMAFPNLIAFWVWTASIYTLARMLGSERLAALVAAGLAGQLPILLGQFNSLHVDMPFAALFLAALCFLIHFLRRYQTGSLLMLLLTFGLLAGVKMSAVGYIVGLCLVGLFWFLACTRRTIRLMIDRQTWMSLGLGCIFLLFVGGYWYAANWIQAGNPLGLVNVKVGPVILFQGNETFDGYLNLIYPHFSELKTFIQTTYGNPANFDALAAKTSLFRVMDWTSRSDWRIVLKQIWQQGGLAGVLLAAGALLSLLQMAKRKPTWPLEIGLLGILALTIALYIVTPYGGDNGSHNWRITNWIGQAYRYALPSAGILAVLAAYGLSRPRWISLLMAAPLVMLTVQAVIIYSTNMPIILLGILALVVASLAFGLFWSRRRVLTRLALVGSLFLMLLAMPLLSKEREQRRLLMFNGIEAYLVANTRPGEKIGYLMTYFSYPLYTAEINRQPVFSPAFSDHREDWISNLDRQGIRFVAIGPFGSDEWKKTREYTWLEDPQGPFERVFGSDPRGEFALYRLK